MKVLWIIAVIIWIGAIIIGSHVLIHNKERLRKMQKKELEERRARKRKTK